LSPVRPSGRERRESTSRSSPSGRRVNADPRRAVTTRCDRLRSLHRCSHLVGEPARSVTAGGPGRKALPGGDQSAQLDTLLSPRRTGSRGAAQRSSNARLDGSRVPSSAGRAGSEERPPAEDQAAQLDRTGTPSSVRRECPPAEMRPQLDRSRNAFVSSPSSLGRAPAGRGSGRTARSIAERLRQFAEQPRRSAGRPR
jgi:hypothetical protein